MINKFFLIIKKIVMSSLMIYSLNMIVSSINIYIPINFINIGLVCLFDFFGLICLVVFSFMF